jgi:tyrosinase
MKLKPVAMALSALCVGAWTMTAFAAEPVKRKDVNALTAAELKAFRDGVAKMMSFDNGVVNNAGYKPLGWVYQASIHGTPEKMVRDAWDTCEHASFLFLSWHRMELYFFERIVRAASGSPALTLPFWNWDKDAKIPPSFRVRPTGVAPNSLFWPYRRDQFNRAPGAAADPADPLPAAVVTSKKAFEQKALYTNVYLEGLLKSFGGGARTTKRHTPGGNGAGQIERTPHDTVHGAVGVPQFLDPPANTMPNPDFDKSLGNPAGAGLDPLFWPFHANIDRAWACWQKLHPADAAPTASTAWMKDLKFTFYDVKFKTDGSLDPDGTKVQMTGEQVINTATQLGYVYDGDPCANFEGTKAREVGEPDSLAGVFGDVLTLTTEKEVMLADRPVSVTIPLTHEVRERIENLVGAGARSGAILLNVGGLAAEYLVTASYGIYLDLPEGAVPDPDSRHYTDEMSLFGLGYRHAHRTTAHAEHSMVAEPADEVDDERAFDITGTVRDLLLAGAWNGDALTVTFANQAAVNPARGGADAAPAGARLRFTYVDLFVQ